MAETSVPMLVALLCVYGIGMVWVFGLCFLTIGKFAGTIEIGRPRLIFASPRRAAAVTAISAILLVVFDQAIKAAGIL